MVAVDVVPPVAFEFGEQAVRHGVDDREVVGQDVRSAVEEDVAVRTEVQKVLREVGTAVLPGPDMSRFAVAMAGRGQDQGGGTDLAGVALPPPELADGVLAVLRTAPMGVFVAGPPFGVVRRGGRGFVF